MCCGVFVTEFDFIDTQTKMQADKLYEILKLHLKYHIIQQIEDTRKHRHLCLQWVHDNLSRFSAMAALIWTC